MNTLTLNVYPGAAGDPQVTTAKQGGGVQVVLLTEPGPGGMRQPLKELLTAFRQGNDRAKVIIRASDSLDYRYIEPVLLTCAASNIETINFAVRTAEGQ